ncbi:MAG: DUF885 domain-containing protein [Pseudomonadota bacterium]|jgi:uncharacterized protein (DUF885 family)
MRVKAALLVATALCAGGMGVAQAAGPALHATAAEVRAGEEDARLNAWLDEQYEAYLDLSPVERTYAGDKKDYDKVDDFSEQGLAARVEFRRKSVVEMRARFDRVKLSPDAQVSYDLWIYEAEQAALDYKFRRNDYVFNHSWGPQIQFAQLLIQIQKIDEPADMDAYVGRIHGLSRALLQHLDWTKANAAAGVRMPRFAYDVVIGQARALAGGAPFDGAADNAVWADVVAKVDRLAKAGKIDRAKAEACKTAARQALIEAWGPAYRELAAWLEADRSNTAEIATGVGKDPGGAAYYVKQLASSTSTDLTPEQVHQIGLAKVAELRQAMEKIKTQVGFKGSLQDFFKFLRDDDRFYYPDTDAGRQAYIDKATQYIADVRKKLPEYFGILPKAEVVVKRVEPYREKPGAAQHYLMAAPDGSRPGVFYAHLSDMRAMPIPQLEAVTYHEAGLGHHLQFSIAQELKNVPKFRTRLFYNVYQEGWGLYTEQLGKEMGGYQDPYSDFGRLSLQMWRAIRLVLDTGLHYKGWTEDQAVRYFAENSPQAESGIRAEVQRYISAPGQATGYMIGMLKITELRHKAEQELGSQFDIRGFHDVVLGRGQMPLNMLERRVDEWIAERKAR